MVSRLKRWLLLDWENTEWVNAARFGSILCMDYICIKEGMQLQQVWIGITLYVLYSVTSIYIRCSR